MKRHIALTKWMKENRGKQQELAELLGVTVGFVSHMVVGRKLVPVCHLEDISKFTGIAKKDLRPDISKLFEKEESK